MTLQAKAQTPVTRWTLTKIDVVSKLRPEAQVVAESYSPQGGDVEVVARGEARYNNDPPVCPGGLERIHFHWEFPQDITHIDSGEKRGVVVTVKTVAIVKPCWGGFSDNSGMDVLGDNGWPYDAQREQIDVDRVWTDGTNSASSKGDGGTASPGIEFGNWPAKDGEPFAYFYIQLHTYLSPPVFYIYMYKNNADGTEPAGGVMPPGTSGAMTSAAEPKPAPSPPPSQPAKTAAPAEPLTPEAETLKAAVENDPLVEDSARKAPAIVLLVEIGSAQGQIASGNATVAVDEQAKAYRAQPAATLWHDLDQAGTEYLNSLSRQVASAPGGRTDATVSAAAFKLQFAKEQFAAEIGQGLAPAEALALADRAVADLQGEPDPRHFAPHKDLVHRALDQLIGQPAPQRPKN